MKFLYCVLLLLFLPVFATFAQDKERATNTPDRKSVKGFGGQLIVVENPREFIEQWAKPNTPTIKPAKEVTRGEQIGAFILFAGCKTDPAGACNAEVDYTILLPDGSILSERMAQPLWKDKAPPAPNIQLGSAILAFRLGDEQPDGDYTVKARVSDLNSDITFDLETHFRLR